MKLSEYLDINNASELASAVGISNAYLSQIKSEKRQASASLCINIERETAGAVRCEELRPDVDWAYLRGTSKTKSKKSRVTPCTTKN